MLSRTYLLLLAAISSLIFLMSRLHFSISTTFRPSTVNKGKQQGCYHGQKSLGSGFTMVQNFRELCQWGYPARQQLPQAAWALPQVRGAAKARGDLGNPQEFSAANADNIHRALIHSMAITSQLLHSSRQLFCCLHSWAAEQESEEILSRKKPHSPDGMISRAMQTRPGRIRIPIKIKGFNSEVHAEH